ncbi:2OG-Fe(II) oxygenase [Aspergillus mulundensis]|uniref:Fe2OG dioxygenase domain-containing protein n=1 Tax=Aspergillus mulundensis TaxID=1810919 RepID=A0A3D8SV92_9EURO|nr:Uncharacterized protein DSM5745_01969 [Aspergillus mulundensis]RDW90194.1 Uncharacterized protein DSM5745_01969 [Aspergillus mulundensis]
MSDSDLDSDKALEEALERLETENGRNSEDDTPSSTWPWSKTAIAQAFREIGNHMDSPFTCGGTIDITDHKDSNKSGHDVAAKKTSLPVTVYWRADSVSKAHWLTLPVQSTSVLRQLVDDCEPATFGRGQEDVLDPKYRMAGKMDTNNFSTLFHPGDFGIIENIEKVLLPSVSTEEQSDLGFRKLHAELYKLNVYSGPSGLFRKHVDTPRSENQVGSLVVCLPSKFRGGKFTVQHAGKIVEFDWSPLSDSAIQWAAFYSDCEHEINTVTEGERITLTYNLYVTEPVVPLSCLNSIIQPKSWPLYGLLETLIAEPGFMTSGGVMGVPCTHAYPHTSHSASSMLPRGLKGGDLMVYSVLKALGIRVKVLPVLEKPRRYDDREHKGEELVGTDLWELSIDSCSEVQESSDFYEVLDSAWPAYRAKGIKWIPGHRHSKLALTHIAYGNEATIGTVYSYAAIFAVIPPFTDRKLAAKSGTCCTC